MSKKTFFAFFLCAMALAWVSVEAQEFKATVTVNYDQLPLDKRDDILTMQQDVMNYVNNQRYSGKDWEGPQIPVDITIYITARSDNRYSARMFMVSKRNLDDSGKASSVLMKVFDDKWQFPYARYANLSYQPSRYDEFSSLLDFYLLIALGLDADTYAELDGTNYYNMARQIAQMGINQNVQGFNQYFQPGELTRFSLISDLTDMRFEDFRKLIFSYHVDGMDRLAMERPEALRMLDAVLSDMLTFKRNKTSSQSPLIQIFFDAKNAELIDLFHGSASQKTLQKLLVLDPGHTSIYNEALERK